MHAFFFAYRAARERRGAGFHWLLPYIIINTPPTVHKLAKKNTATDIPRISPNRNTPHSPDTSKLDWHDENPTASPRQLIEINEKKFPIDQNIPAAEPAQPRVRK